MKTRDALSPSQPHAGLPQVEWVVADGLTPYEDAVAEMETRVAAIAEGAAAERVWLVEHPPLYTAGTSSRGRRPPRRPLPRAPHRARRAVHLSRPRPARGLCHAGPRRRARPGQPDVRAFVAALEAWIIATLGRFNVRGERREDRVGVWVRGRTSRPARRLAAEDKIAAIGIRVRRWVSYHGISLNVEPELGHFSGIVPCGIATPAYGVTSLVDLGLPVTMARRGRRAPRRVRGGVRAHCQRAVSLTSAP